METETKTEKIVSDGKYISIPWASFLRFIVFVGSIALVYGCFLLTNKFWQSLRLGKLSKEEYYSISQLVILPWFVIEYCLIGLSFVCLTAWIKKGFSNLKSFEEKGLIFWLIVGLIGGLIFWLAFGLIGGLIFWLIVGLIGGLISVLILGLQVEFR